MGSIQSEGGAPGALGRVANAGSRQLTFPCQHLLRNPYHPPRSMPLELHKKSRQHLAKTSSIYRCCHPHTLAVHLVVSHSSSISAMAVRPLAAFARRAHAMAGVVAVAGTPMRRLSTQRPLPCGSVHRPNFHRRWSVAFVMRFHATALACDALPCRCPSLQCMEQSARR